MFRRTRIMLTAFAVSFAVGVTVSAAAEDGDDNGAGHTGEPAPGEIVSSFVTGGQIWSTAVSVDGTVYVGSDDGCLWALDLDTLELKWRVPTGGRVRSTPAVAGGKIYFSSDDGFLYCVAASDGSRLWRFDLGESGIERVMPSQYPPYGYDYLSSSPVIHEGVIFIGGADGNLYAVGAGSGTEKWRFATGARIRSTPTVSENRIYVGSWDHFVYALSAKNGEQIWKFDTGGIVQASPAIGDGRVYIGSRNPKVFALDAASGEPIWEHIHTDGSWVESSGVYRDGVLYVGSSDSLALFAFDGKTGGVIWKYRTGGWSWCTPSISGKTIYIGAISAFPYYFEGVTLEQGLHAVDLETGKPRWVLPTRALPGFVSGGVMATPLVVDGKVIIGALDNHVIAVKE